MTSLIRTFAALLAGLAMWGAFPPHNFWFLAVFSLGMLTVVLGVGSIRLMHGFYLGFIFGIGFFVPLLPWIGEYVGPLPWLALSGMLSVHTAFLGMLSTLTMRLPFAPIWFAASWTTVETVRSMFPFGGFPWGRVAFSQTDGPLLPLASIIGTTGLSFGVSLLGASVCWLLVIGIRTWQYDLRSGFKDTCILSAGLITTVVTMLLFLSPQLYTNLIKPSSIKILHSPVSTKIAIVQGSVPQLGLEFNAQRRAVLEYHVSETLLLSAYIDAGHVAQPDFVIWPENASDISPIENPEAAEQIQIAASAVNAPIVLGTILTDNVGNPTNSVVVWDPHRGIVQRYDKHIIQPFGEYMPWRRFFRIFSSYVDMAGNFTPGHGPSIVQIPTRADTVVGGITTCWEVAFDRTARQSVKQGAQVLIVPTNNATFGKSAMTYQQLAMAKVRAVENGRAVLVAATSGVSAIIGPNGDMRAHIGVFTPGILADRIPLRTERTPASKLGAIPEIVICGSTLIAILTALTMHTEFGRKHLSAPRVPQ